MSCLVSPGMPMMMLQSVYIPISRQSLVTWESVELQRLSHLVFSTLMLPD